MPKSARWGWMALFTCLGCSGPAPMDVPDTGGGTTDAGGMDAAPRGDAAPLDAPSDAALTTAVLVTASAGGLVESADGLFEIWIAPGALASDTTISITRVAAADVPPDVAAMHPDSAVYAVEPDGLTFGGGGAWAHYTFATAPPGAITTGAMPSYAAFGAYAQPAEGGTIHAHADVRSFYDAATRALDVVARLDHFSRQFATSATVPGLRMAADIGDREQIVGTPWLAREIVLEGPHVYSYPGETPNTPLTDTALAPSAYGTVTAEFRDASGAPIDPTVEDALDALGIRLATTAREQRLGPADPGADPWQKLFSSPLFSCEHEGPGRAGVNGFGFYGRYGYQVSISTPIDCIAPPVATAQVSETTTCRREGTAVVCTDPPAPTAHVTAVAVGRNYQLIPNGVVALSPVGAAPAPGPTTITATSAGSAMVATRDATGDYTPSFIHPPTFHFDVDIDWTTDVGATTTTTSAIAPTDLRFGPVTGLDTDVVAGTTVPLGTEVRVRLEPVSASSTVVCNTGTYHPTLTGAFQVEDLGDGTQGIDAPVRALLDQTATACSIPPSTLEAIPFYVAVEVGDDAILDGSVAVSSARSLTVDTAALTATCPAGRTYCTSACVNTATDPANCGSCGGHPAEICDGLDNDCDGLVDDGCPSYLQWFASDTSTSPLFGPSAPINSSAYSYLCPYPTVITGICGSDNGPVRTLTYECGRVALVVDTSTVPYGYAVQVATTISCTSPGMGWSGGGATDWTPFHCPPNTLMDQLLVTSGSNLGQIQIGCSEWDVVPSGSGWAVQRTGSRTLSPRFGSGPGTDMAWTIADDATTGFPGAIRYWGGRVADLGPYLSIQARGASPTLVLH